MRNFNNLEMVRTVPQIMYTCMPHTANSAPSTHITLPSVCQSCITLCFEIRLQGEANAPTESQNGTWRREDTAESRCMNTPPLHRRLRKRTHPVPITRLNTRNTAVITPICRFGAVWSSLRAWSLLCSVSWSNGWVSESRTGALSVSMHENGEGGQR